MSVIADIREQGYAQTTGDVTPTFGAIAMTVPAPSGLMPMAVGVGVPLERIDGKRDQIVRAIREFSETLGTVAADKRSDEGDAKAGVWS
jgi:DNA-binding IclR family transcriptional regulator